MRRSPTRLVVIQATPFCNIDCSYCYLSNRAGRDRISIATVRAIGRALAESSSLTDELTILWHAGEPLVLPIEFYEEAQRVLAEELGARSVLHHTVQTNATLISRAWCEFFEANGWSVGVSLDGPAVLHDRYRRDRQGRGTHDRGLAGVRLLQKYQIDLGVICVLTADSIQRPDQIWHYFQSIGITNIGFNLEEVEGDNLTSTLCGLDGAETIYASFLRRISELRKAQSGGDGVYVREICDLDDAIRFGSGDPESSENTPLAILTFDVLGNFSTFSPELVGITHPVHGRSMSFGNAHQDRIDDIFSNPWFTTIHDEIEAGVSACRDQCGYFLLCGGGPPSNKLAENGTFASTETAHCRAKIKAATDIMLSGMEQEYLGSDIIG